MTVVLSLGALPLYPDRPKPPTRSFDDPGAPEFIRLDDRAGINPPIDSIGNYLVGPNYLPTPERNISKETPRGKVFQFTIDSKTASLLNPGIARKVFGTIDPDHPRTLLVDTHEINYTRQITVHVASQYKKGKKAPFMVCHDGPKGNPKQVIFNILDNLIAEKQIPPLIAILVANGGGDAQGHQRGKEYDTMSGLYADYIEKEVLPLVEKNCGVRLTSNPDGRAVMGPTGKHDELCQGAFSLRISSHQCNFP